MKNLSIICFLLLYTTMSSIGQEVLKVWEHVDAPVTYNISDESELTVYLPKQKKDSTKSAAVLVFPGGGYAGVSMDYEGHALAKWLQSEGFAAIVLKYRLPNGHKEVPFDDAEESLNIIKSNAEKWNINLDKIGIAGSSAGGHLAAVFTNKLVNKTESIHPAFNILFYPVISMEKLTKGKTRDNLLDKDPSAEDIRNYSAQFLVTSRTPPTIIFVSDNDESVPPMHSIIYYEALNENQIPASIYMFPTGGHGWAMLDGFEYNQLALSLLSKWLQQFK